MNLKKSISIIVQTVNGRFTENGLYGSAEQVTGIDLNLGLMIMAQGSAQGEQSVAYKSIEIMLDDMKFNLLDEHRKSDLPGSIASQCLSESLENINEYLCSQVETNESPEQEAGVELTAIQVYKNTISCCGIGGLSYLKFGTNDSMLQNGVLSAKNKLGIAAVLHPKIDEQDFVKGDIALLLSSELLLSLGQEFIRVTLSRFNENLEMALRQINTRALQNGFKQKPTIIICRMNKTLEKQRSWLSKLRN